MEDIKEQELMEEESKPIVVLEGDVIDAPQSTSTDEVLTKKEQEVTDYIRDVRLNLVKDIVEKNSNTLHKDPELISALGSLLNAQDSQTLGVAKLRQKADQTKNESENVKALITATLQSVNKKKDNIKPIENGREVRHVEVSLVEGQTDVNTRQFTLEELEKNVSTKRGIRPEEIIKEK